MGNIITLNETTPVSEYLSMSNGTTSAFINVFGLSGSRLAQNDQEKRLIVWVLEKNQTFVGIGTVGLRICDMPWKDETFSNDKTFILSVLDDIKKKTGWETLGYNPSEKHIFYCVDYFKNLLNKMTVEDINHDAIVKWETYTLQWDPVLHGFPKCEKHGVLLTIWGCQACTD